MKRRILPRSIGMRMLLSIAGAFVILTLSTAYILVSAKNLQNLSNSIFEQERFIKSVREDLEQFRVLLLDYLSTRSSNALAAILIDIQTLRAKLPSYMPIQQNTAELRERELYSLIRSYLNLAEQAMEEKRGRNIAAYTRIYDEMAGLMDYINREIETISTGRFRGQMDAYSLFIARSGTLQFWNLLFIIFISLFAILILFQSVRRITGPMTRLSAMAAELSAGNFSIADIESESVREMDQVVAAFNKMKNEIGNYIQEIRWQENIKQEYMREKMRNMKMEGLVRHMEIYALQAQMNPHFLFNTINTGMQLAIVEGADRTSEYMEYMAKLFRHIIRNKEIIVPLRHEIEGLECYYYILRVRFPRSLDLTLECEQALLDSVKVPVSILQPLVENCVIHAFKDGHAPSAQAGGQNGDAAMTANAAMTPDSETETEKYFRVNVRAQTQGRHLILSVRDNGRGMEVETVQRLLHPHSIDESSVSRVMGLENVIQRLYFFYPDDPGVVSIETGPGKGTAVIIRIDTGREPCIAF